MEKVLSSRCMQRLTAFSLTSDLLLSNKRIRDSNHIFAAEKIEIKKIRTLNELGFFFVFFLK